MDVLVRTDRPCVRCGCTTGYWTQASAIPFRHRHVPVVVSDSDRRLEQLGHGDLMLGTVPVPPGLRTRRLGSRVGAWVSWLERHRLVAYPRGLSKRQRRHLTA